VKLHKLHIVGDGAFGSFLKELLAPHYEFSPDATSVLLAVPISAYESVASLHKDKHLINVCSVQKPTTDICLKHSELVTSIHPLFGRRTPADKRNTIVTYSYQLSNNQDDSWWYDDNNPENCFMRGIRKVSTVFANDTEGLKFTPESHDILMAKTHLAAVMGAQQLKVFVDRAKDLPDFLLPNSFRLMREFVKTLEDMPAGTIESIMANPYA
jgi:prephenate dehydrogenase